jgi:pimeloyl-ACP methyl ester carboxylesterase
MAGDSSDELALEGMRFVWPTYRRSRARTADARATNRDGPLGRDGALDPGRTAGARGGAAGDTGPRRLRARLAEPDARRRLDGRAERIPSAWVEVVEGAGHLVWVEAPGAVRAALRRLTTGAADGGYDR